MAIQISQSHEYSQEQLKTMENPDIHAHAVSRTPHRRNVNRQHSQSQTGTSRTQKRSFQQKVSKGNCGNCGYQHKPTEVCPAKGKQCASCKKWNHFAKVCRSSKYNVNLSNSKVYGVNTHEPEQSDPDSDPEFFVDSIHSNIKNGQAFIKFMVGPHSSPVKFKLDTGSQANIIPEHVYDKLGLCGVLQIPKRKLSAYNGGTLHTLGVCRLSCTYKNKTHNIEFYIVDTTNTPILGLQTCLDLALIKLVYSVDTSCIEQIESDKTNVESQSSVLTHEKASLSDSSSQFLDKPSVLKQYSPVFKGIGLFPGECKIQLDPNAVPVVHPPRRVPFALRDKLKQELDRMEKANIIAKVSTPTEWVNSLVVVEKSNKLRVCLDPRDLNKAILRPHYPMRTLDDILPHLTGAKYFTKLDARSGYWTIKLAEESSYLTTFNTPFGRFRFCRLPFGLKSSQDEFQRKIDECFEGLPGIVAIVDDILVYGRTRQEHDKNLRSVLERSIEKGIRLNEDKLEVGVTQVPYFGHIISSEGLKPDPSKVSAVKDMQPPRNKAELETVLGMINYLAKFAPNLSEITSPLRSLLVKDVQFSWDHPQAQAFEKVKEVITQSPVLAYFDHDKDLTLQVDASKFGLGATLMQDGKPIAFASKSLTQSEINNAQIEKEMFAILFGCKHFHQFVYGRLVHIETDHKPLVSIMSKPLHVAPPRLQRMMLQLQRYDLILHHLPGKSIPVADTLSRNFQPHTYPKLSEGMDVHVHTVLKSIPISDCKLEQVRNATVKDPQLVMLKQIILAGWPECRKSCPPLVLDYWNHRDELTYTNGLILKGTKIVIPKDLRSEMLDRIHSGHMGIEKCLSRARDILFWPKMSTDVTELVSTCPVCLEFRNSNPKEPLVPHDIPDYPWQNVATDLFTLNGQDYIVVVDYFSRYFEFERLNSTTSDAVITKLKNIFPSWNPRESSL